MTATSRAPRRPRIRPRGPPPAPPTPIRTARGARSAAADERVLAEFLEASLRVPDLALPPRAPRKRFFSFPPAPPPPREVPSQALASGDADAALRAASAAAESGAFAVAGAIDASEVREAVEASRAVFAAPDEVKREQLARWFRRKDDEPTAGGEEFCWFRPVSPDEDRALGAALPGSTYRVFRMDTVASRMENVAKNAIKVLSDNVKNPKDSALSREAPSILRLTLHNSCKSKTSWDEFGSTDPPNSHALNIHLSERDRQICLRNQGGSTIFTSPAGSMLVTIGKQVQEWSNGQFRTAVGEVLYEMTDEPGPFISLELVYSPDDLHLSEVGRQARCIDRPKAISFRDQILVVLILLFLFYVFWR
ncbi:hypothetical protein SEVIR_5G368700v4 [Setaria viridis]|uniref:uncharacterized protein isoform X2 n=1 Tax=Setaria viridis TaxID=4556 RepID=UPI0014937F19|nr:uncharacterized protein LOC117855078 isoform X2 [Setaria viridis]